MVLDEAGMARTDDLAKLLRLAEEHGSKVVLVGDPHQLGAVGPGGIFRTLVADHGAHELETVRRFHHAWEAAASLHLREGNPAILDCLRPARPDRRGQPRRDDRPRLRGVASRVRRRRTAPADGGRQRDRRRACAALSRRARRARLRRAPKVSRSRPVPRATTTRS